MSEFPKVQVVDQIKLRDGVTHFAIALVDPSVANLEVAQVGCIGCVFNVATFPDTLEKSNMKKITTYVICAGFGPINEASEPIALMQIRDPKVIKEKLSPAKVEQGVPYFANCGVNIRKVPQ